ncbi:M20/M25/M40 family metallo-hydrolase [Foetidibacter luteolus]|uniref:M20/M25/M40 family metallo-hydrolase n=1 Tax=Foetidibacter luteolus TaxID=2608880 RepID=UPI00129B41FE|nr:M20/M25/M40 family metallo-hydrolase [Foetidibacter luteolus]
MKKLFYLAAILVTGFVGIILINTARYSTQIPHTNADHLPVYDSIAVNNLSRAIQMKTISEDKGAVCDTASFVNFRNFLDSSYPLIHAQLEKTIINEFSYIYRWKGNDSSLKPYLFLAHSDVVPVEPSSQNLWHVPPFAGTIKDSAVWGRGAIDDKGSLIALMEACEALLKQGFKPRRDIYLCFGHDEELGGNNGAAQIVKWFESKNIYAALVADEGGIITKENFKDLNRPVALLGVAEKGHVSFELTVEKEGGHSSMPEKETAIDILSRALTHLREKPTPVNINAATNAMLNKIGPGLGFTTRMALANRWVFESMLIKTFESSKGKNASIHTTIVPTIIESGVKENVIPSVAKATVNCRIMPGESAAGVLAFIKDAINDDRIKIKQLPFFAEPGKTSPIDGVAYKKAEAAAYKLMDDIIPVPFLMIGATDGRYYDKISDAVIRFLPALDPQGFHGIDEKITFDDFRRMIYYYQLMIKE